MQRGRAYSLSAHTPPYGLAARMLCVTRRALFAINSGMQSPLAKSRSDLGSFDQRAVDRRIASLPSGEGRGYPFWNSFKQSWMQIVDDAQLEMLTVTELRDLKDRIDLAIRAAIRASRAPKTEAPISAAEPVKFDLERERDAWLLAKK